MLSQRRPAAVDSQPYAEIAPLPRRRWNLLWILFSFNGRIDRSQYWAGIGVTVLVAVPALLAITARFDDRVGAEDAEAYAYALMSPFLLWTSLATSVKRLHDRDKSGWWALIQFIPFIGEFWILAECGGMPGTYGKNKYDDRITFDGGAFLSALIRFVPEVAILLFYLYTSLYLAMIGIFGLAGIYEASMVTVAAIAGLMALIIYALPLALFVYSGWLHFKKRQYRRALLVMAPLAVVALFTHFSIGL